MTTPQSFAAGTILQTNQRYTSG